MALSVKAISDSVKTISISESEPSDSSESSESKYILDECKKSSEYCAEKTIQTWEGKSSRFDVNSENSLEDWLQLNKPSGRLSEKGEGFALIYDSETEAENDIDDQSRDEALEIWQNLIDSKVHITHDIIQDIAEKYDILSGRWLCYFRNGLIVDKIWRSICTRYKNDKFNHYVLICEVSPVGPDNRDQQISIKNRNYTDTSAVFAVERILREIGVKCKLCYKPAIHSYFEIYSNNEWSINPTIFKSVYDIKTKESFITDTRNEQYF